MAKAGTGAGTVGSSPAGIDCGATCTASYPPLADTVVTLTASPAAGSVFAGWSGACTNAAGACTVTMTAAHSVTATFNLANYALAVAKTGAGAGTVTGSGIACGTDCGETYNYGTAVTLTAAAATGSAFAGWSGGVPAPAPAR